MNLNTKYRPKTFDEICGQTITTKLLKKIVETKNYRNCYLFCGTSGCGKTTAARCFARAINGLDSEPIEIDGASHGNVDTIRELIESANKRSLTDEYKIIIVDECQSVTGAAWNAFLKGLEETPKYTIFIFCTTDPQKIPNTVLNRMQRYNFAPISTKEIYNRLVYICQQEGFINYEPVCDFLSKVSKGEMRNAITWLDQIASYSENSNGSNSLSLEIAKSVLGGISYETFFKLTWALTKQKSEETVISIIDELFEAGSDLKNFIALYLEFILDLNKFVIFNNIDITNIPSYLSSTDNPVTQYTVDFADNRNTFNKMADKLLELKVAIKNDSNYKSTILVYLLQMCRGL